MYMVMGNIEANIAIQFKKTETANAQFPSDDVITMWHPRPPKTTHTFFRWSNAGKLSSAGKLV